MSKNMSNTDEHSKPVSFGGMTPLLLVYHMPDSLHFYRDILGFEIVMASEESYGPDNFFWVLLKLNETELMMEPRYPKDIKPSERPLKEHDVIFYVDCRAVDELYEYLLSKDVKVEKPHITGYGYKALDVKDPDGIRLVFHYPLED